MRTILHRALPVLVALAAFALMVPGQAVAAPWCDICDDTNDCFACCRCAGGSPGTCFFECDFFLTLTDDASLLQASDCEAPPMTIATPEGEAAEPELTEAGTTEAEVSASAAHETVSKG